jgi:hypothetical protein
MIAHVFVAPALLGLGHAKGECMANQRDRDTNDLIRDSDEFGGSSADRTPGAPSGERVGGRSEENMRGTGDDSDEDEFEDSDDVEDEDEEGTI